MLGGGRIRTEGVDYMDHHAADAFLQFSATIR